MEDQAKYEIKVGQHGKGCECSKCQVFLNDRGHARTCRCDECVAYWEQQQVEPDRVDPEPKTWAEKQEQKADQAVKFVRDAWTSQDTIKKNDHDTGDIKYDPKSRYYYAGGLEVLDVIRAKLTPEQYQGFCLGNVIKYTCRANFKGDYDRDMEKAEFYSREAK